MRLYHNRIIKFNSFCAAVGDKVYDFSSLLFWYKFIFLTELLFGYMIIIFRLNPKRNVWWRILVCFIVACGLAFAIPVIHDSALYLSFMSIALFSITVFIAKFCMDESWKTVIFVGMFAYTVQHISYQLYTLVCNLLNVGGNIYTSSASTFAEPLSILIFFSSHVLIYVIAWAVLSYKLKDVEDFIISRNSLIFLSIIILLSDVVINAIVVYNVISTSKIILNIIAVYNIMTCVFALCVQFLMLNSEHYESELKIVESLWRRDRQTFEMTKESIELINTKCHDLRHRMNIARNRPRIDENELAEIEKAINIYEENIKTGNDTLDIILSEASFVCHNNGITLICIADGKLLNYMHSGDIYSLIQNAVNNAINAVGAVTDEGKRIIRIMVRQQSGVVCIHIENYFDGSVQMQFKDGVPVTGQDTRYHGFGMRSIKNVCKKYGGKVDVEVEEDIFNLDITLPLKADI